MRYPWSKEPVARVPSKGMAVRGLVSGRGPRSGKDERQRTFRRHMGRERRYLLLDI